MKAPDGTLIVLGVDPGTARTGYGVVASTEHGLSLLECGVVRTRPRHPLADRICHIFEAMKSVIERFEPSVLSVEKVFQGKNPQSALTLGHARGVILLAGALAGVRIAEYSPTAIKSAVVGTGRATKEQVGFMVKTHLRLASAPSPNDAADGVAVALCHFLIGGPARVISRLHGILLEQDMDSVEIETAGGVVYEVNVPSTVAGRLPPPGSQVGLRTVQVVRDDSVALYGFLEVHERDMFQRLLGTTGVGAKLAREMLSTYSARRLAQALANKETAVLTRVNGVGKKTAELLILRLSDKVRDLALTPDGGAAAPHGAREAVNALMALGYSFAQADKAVRGVTAGSDAGGEMKTEELIRKALERIGQ